MAASGNQPVSADNLAALAEAMGVSVAASSGALTGSEPICVDNLKAALERYAGRDMVATVIYDNGNSLTATVSLNPADYRLLLISMRFTGVGANNMDPLVVMNPKIGYNTDSSGAYASVSVTQSGSGYTVQVTGVTSGFVIKKITAYR